MGRVVGHDDVHVEVGGHAVVDAVEELAELDSPVAAVRLGDDGAGLDVERCKQRRGAVSPIVVRSPFGLAGLHRQQRRGAENVGPTSHTPEFTERTVPDGLKANHAPAPGVWARIIVTAGRLHYRVDALSLTMELTPEVPGVVVPEVPHGVEPMGPVRFRVEFLRTPPADS